MTTQDQQSSPQRQLRMIDEAQYLLKSLAPRSPSFREPTADEVALLLIDMLRVYAEVDLSAEQEAEALKVFRSLPVADASLELFAKICEEHSSLTSLGNALRVRLAESHTLQDDVQSA
jgi:hypothetical protein